MFTYDPFEAFDPQQLAPWASLNRTSIRDDASFDAEARGRPAGSLLSAGAINQAIVAAAGPLGMTVDALMRTPPAVLLETRLASPDAAIVSAAGEIARRFGRYLGCLLVTLLDGAPTRWPEALRERYLQHWTTIEHVRLCGGNVRGEFGRRLCEAARETLTAHGHGGLDLLVAPHPQEQALIGAARSVDRSAEAALVYDFGGTLVKHGLATHEAGAVRRLHVSPALPARFLERPARRATVRARRLAQYMTRIVEADWRTAGGAGLDPSPDVRVAIGSYVRDGQLLSLRHETYGMLDLLPAREEVWLSETLSKRLDRRMSVTLSHDGTTAARAFAGQPRTAVIMLGTWLGAGFAPEDGTGLRPLAGFEVVT